MSLLMLALCWLPPLAHGWWLIYGELERHQRWLWVAEFNELSGFPPPRPPQ